MKRRNFLQIMAALAAAPLVSARAKRVQALIDTQLAKGPAVPVGYILPFAGKQVPPGWLPCDGRQIARNQYAELFKLLDGKVPDMRPNLPGNFDSNPKFKVVQYIIKAKA